MDYHRGALVLVVTTLAASAGFYSHAGELPDGVSIGPPPAWAETNIPVDLAGDHDVQDGRTFLLHSKQIRIHPEPAERQRYIRNVWTYRNSAGVDAFSQLYFGFNPAFERIVLHEIRVQREDQTMDKLAESEIRLLSHENRADYLVYDGEKELNVLMHDIRVGDRIDYSFSVVGENPVFADNAEGTFQLNWEMPIVKQAYRLIAPPNVNLQQRNQNFEGEFSFSEDSRLKRYSLDIENSERLRVDSDQPLWYSDAQKVAFSTAQGWSDVRDWITPIYQSSVDAAAHLPLLNEVARQIKQSAPNTSQQTAEALFWVQSNIRYLGLSLGEHSHRPSPPQLVLQRRFGDCKDMTVLLLGLLKILGIEAYAALVNTETGPALTDNPHRLHAFDHVLVAVVKGGQYVWLDPTLSDQKGQIGEFYQPDYGLALIMRSGETRLVSMENDASTIELSGSTHLQLHGQRSADMVVSTYRKGRSAEAFRRYLQNQTKQEIKEQYERYYADKYGTASMAGNVWVREQSGNQSESMERYELKGFYHNDPDCDCEQFAYADLILGQLSYPSETSNRETPFAVTHPVVVEETINVRTFFAVYNTTEDFVEDNEYFHFHRQLTSDNKRREVVVKLQFETKADHVPVDKLMSYQEKMDLLYDQLYYDVTEHRVLPGHLSSEQWVLFWRLFAASTLIMVVSALAYWLLIRRSDTYRRAMSS